jgi:hypothetical protein
MLFLTEFQKRQLAFVGQIVFMPSFVLHGAHEKFAFLKGDVNVPPRLFWKVDQKPRKAKQNEVSHNASYFLVAGLSCGEPSGYTYS